MKALLRKLRTKYRWRPFFALRYIQVAIYCVEASDAGRPKWLVESTDASTDWTRDIFEAQHFETSAAARAYIDRIDPRALMSGTGIAKHLLYCNRFKYYYCRLRGKRYGN